MYARICPCFDAGNPAGLNRNSDHNSQKAIAAGSREPSSQPAGAM